MSTNMSNKKTILQIIAFCFSISINTVVAAPTSLPLHSNIPFFYESFMGNMIKKVLANPFSARVAGWYTNTSMSTIHIAPFIKKHAINMQEAEKKLPEQYKSFNDFFTRKLKPGARPIDTNAESIISPVDGYVHVINNVQEKTTLAIKGKPFVLSTFLHDATMAKRFYGGTMIIIYLAPWNYHRFHFPYDSYPSLPIHINGSYESVHPAIFNNQWIQPLQENERHLILMTTQRGMTFAFVPVGAMFVGQITHTYTPYKLHKKGSEVGYFSFGGSTVVLLFPKNSITIDNKYTDKSWQPISMGQPLGMLQQK